jgi:hypothetical protein
LQQKHIAVVAYCSYCREDRGRHTHRGSHSSSHDSRRRYLSDAKINTWKKSLYLEKEHRGIVPGGDGHRGSMSYIFQHYIRVISLVQKGRDYSEEDQRHSGRGSNPKESSGRGSNPKERTTLFH